MRNQVIAGILSAGLCAGALADTTQFQLKNNATTVGGHSFGLRFDNLFRTHNSTNNGYASSTGGFTTFSFNQFSNTVMTVSQTGNQLTINIHGTVDGGRANSGGYVNGFGRGSYELSMTYKANIHQGPNGWRVAAASVQNSGFIKALGGVSGIAAGTTWVFGDQAMAPGSNTLTFFKYGAAAIPIWTGKGWLLAPSAMVGTRQLAFTGATLVPLPPGALAGAASLLGLGGIHVVRRRCRRAE
jgi:hypothetical protein